MEIDKPIFIIGSGRSGTTILYKLMSIHPELCWFSNYMNKYPAHPRISMLYRLLDFPLIGKNLKKSIVSPKPLKLIPKPSEAGNIYDKCGFVEEKKSTESDLKEDHYKLYDYIREVMKQCGKKRFVNKQTSNTQRIRLINKMFPNAYYIHIIRDGRAVANSLYHVDFWKDIVIWWFGDKTSKWKELGRDPIELCGLHWKTDVNEILENKSLFEDRYLEIRYEELTKDTKGVIGQIVSFCGLEWDNSYTKLIPDSLPNMNHKWKEKLSENQKIVLEQSISDFLTQLGYATNYIK